MGLILAKPENLINSYEECTIYYKNDTTFRNSNTKNVIFYHNQNIVTKVNWQDLITHSLYFQSILKPCFNDNKLSFVKVKIPASLKTFLYAMQFVKTGKVSFEGRSVYETCHLAMYLQMDSLQQYCLDKYTYNLTQASLKDEWNLLSNPFYLKKEFKSIALMFKKTRRPTFSGLYFLQEKERGTACLKIFSTQSKSVHLVSELNFPGNSQMHYFNNMLCKVVYSRCMEKAFLFHFDLLSEKTYSVLIENVKVCYTFKPLIVCTDNSLFIISEFQNTEGVSLLSVSMFGKKNLTSSLELYKEKTFHPLLLIGKEYLKKIYLYFSHFYNGNIYVFYSVGDKSKFCGHFCTYDDLYVMTICVKTLHISTNNQFSTFNIKNSNDVNLKNLRMRCVQKIIFSEKYHKLYIRINSKSLGNYNPWGKVLVYDLKNNWFYFHKNFLPATTPAFFNYEFKFATDNDGIVYGTRNCQHDSDGLCTEIRAYQVEN